MLPSQNSTIINSLRRAVLAHLDLILLRIACKPVSVPALTAEIHNEMGVLLSVGTVYPRLRNLVEKNLISCRQSALTPREGRTARTFEITELGQKTLHQMVHQLEKEKGIVLRIQT